MEYIYAALLLHKAKQQITEELLEKALASAGFAVDKAKVKATVAALKNVDIDKVLAETSLAAAPAAVAAGAAPAGKPEAKKEPEEDKGKAEEAAAAGLGALFG